MGESREGRREEGGERREEGKDREKDGDAEPAAVPEQTCLFFLQLFFSASRSAMKLSLIVLSLPISFA